MANITRFDPLGDVVSLRKTIDRIFEDSWVSPLTWRTVSGETVNAPLDVHETPDEIVITVSLPGVKPDDVEITMTGQTLTLRGELKVDETVEREQYLYRERRYGSFSRTLQVPVRVVGDKAQASFSNGVLTLRLPKAEEVKPRQIRITAAESAAENGAAER